MKNVTVKIETKLANTNAQYYILKVIDNSTGEIKKVHTSKKLNYLQQIAKDFNQGYR